jgi:hypothetical protein
MTQYGNETRRNSKTSGWKIKLGFLNISHNDKI